MALGSSLIEPLDQQLNESESHLLQQNNESSNYVTYNQGLQNLKSYNLQQISIVYSQED